MGTSRETVSTETKRKLCAYIKGLIGNPVTTFAGCPSSNVHHVTLMKNFKV